MLVLSESPVMVVTNQNLLTKTETALGRYEDGRNMTFGLSVTKKNEA